MTECGHCQDCKWWWLPGTLGGECRLMESQKGEPVNLRSKAWAQEKQGVTAWVITTPNFGCVQFEPKEAS